MDRQMHITPRVSLFLFLTLLSCKGPFGCGQRWTLVTFGHPKVGLVLSSNQITSILVGWFYIYRTYTVNSTLPELKINTIHDQHIMKIVFPTLLVISQGWCSASCSTTWSCWRLSDRTMTSGPWISLPGGWPATVICLRQSFHLAADSMSPC